MSGNAVNKLLKEIKKYVKQNSALLVACSGGADSAALTDALWQLKDECCYKITVMHVEHGIRGQEALDDAEFVKNFCAERGLAFVCRHVKAPDYALQNGLSLEDAARRLRYKELGIKNCLLMRQRQGAITLLRRIRLMTRQKPF